MKKPLLLIPLAICCLAATAAAQGAAPVSDALRSTAKRAGTNLIAAAEDWADHYSQLAIYLRLNGLLPPTAKKKEG